MVKNIVVSFLLVAASFTPVHAADKAPKDSSVAGELRVRLEDAVRIGLQKSRTLELARLDRRMSSEKLMEATSPVLPRSPPASLIPVHCSLRHVSAELSGRYESDGNQFRQFRHCDA